MYGNIKQHSIMTVADERKQIDVQRLIAAAASGDLELINSITDLSLFQGTDYDGRTALHLACAEGQFDAAKALVALGAGSNVQDRTGKTPLEEAKELQDAELIGRFEELLRTGTGLEGLVA